VLGALAVVAASACLAAPVQAGKVHAGPFTAAVQRPYDVVNGRFRLHVGPYRDAKRHLIQQLDWTVARGSRVQSRLSVTAVRLSPPPRTVFAQWFPVSATALPRGRVFPTLLQPSSAGCWRLTLQTGGAKAALIVLVR
jgi:hypothetical protein